jgi:predicted phage-related endonuclease
MTTQPNNIHRRSFIGGSDARVIMGDDQAMLVRLWREKRGEVEPSDLTDNLIVQLGSVTEELNRRWYERNTGLAIKHVQRRLQHPGDQVDGGDAGRPGRPRWRGV